MAKAKYDWDAIFREYQNGMQFHDILNKYKIFSEVTLRSKLYKKNIKRPEDFKPIPKHNRKQKTYKDLMD